MLQVFRGDISFLSFKIWSIISPGEFAYSQYSKDRRDVVDIIWTHNVALRAYTRFYVTSNEKDFY